MYGFKSHRPHHKRLEGDACFDVRRLFALRFTFVAGFVMMQIVGGRYYDAVRKSETGS